jgi:hypothetical protein
MCNVVKADPMRYWNFVLSGVNEYKESKTTLGTTLETTPKKTIDNWMPIDTLPTDRGLVYLSGKRSDGFWSGYGSKSNGVWKLNNHNGTYCSPDCVKLEFWRDFV